MCNTETTNTECKSDYKLAPWQGLVWVFWRKWTMHYSDVIMSVMPFQITSLTIVYSAVYSGPDQRKHQSSMSLAFVQGIHRVLVNSPHKGPVTWKMFPFDEVIMDITTPSCIRMAILQSQILITKHKNHPICIVWHIVYCSCSIKFRFMHFSPSFQVRTFATTLHN